VIQSFLRKGCAGGPPPENVYIFEAPLLHFFGCFLNYIIELFLIDFHCDTKFPKKRVCGGPPQKMFTFLKLHYCISSGVF
jgi:hypothetical protein